MSPANTMFGAWLVDALGWTLLHFLWQGAVIAAVLAIADLALRRSSAHARYLAACAAMAAMLIVFTGAFVRASRLASATASAHPAALAWERPATSVAGTPLPLEHKAARTAVAAAWRRAPVARATERWNRAAIAARARAVMPWLVALWCAGVVVLSLRLIGGWWLTRLILSRSLATPMTELEDLVTSLRRRLALSTPIRVCRTTWVSVPSVIGWLRPVLLMPASTLTGLSPRQIEAVLAHELAHVQRHDYVVNLLQSIVETLLFYHPAVWWVSRRVREERENCCDDIAVAVCGDALTYARALAELEQLKFDGTPLAMAATGGSLLARIQRLVGVSRVDAPNWTAGILAAVLAMVLVTGVGLGWGIASPQAPAQLGAIERQARTQARRVVERVSAAGAQATVVAATVARAVSAPVVSALEPSPATPIELLVTVVDDPAAAENTDDASSSDVAVGVDATENTGEEAAEITADAAGMFAANGVENDYARDLRRLGFSDVEIVTLHAHGLSLDYVAGIRRAGKRSWDTIDLVRLHDHGVPVEFVRTLSAPALPERSSLELIKLHAHGVSSAFVRRLAAAGYETLSTDDLVRLAAHGVRADYVDVLAGSLDESLSVDSIVELHTYGISAEWAAAMIWMGYDDPKRSDLIALQQHGITPDYVFGFRASGYRALPPSDLIQLRSNGVNPRDVALMRGLGVRDLTVDAMVALRTNGVTADYVRELREAGMRSMDAKALVQLRIYGVRAADVGALIESGVAPLETDDLVRLRNHGVDAAFVSEAMDAGHTDLTVDQLIWLRENGLHSKE